MEELLHDKELQLTFPEEILRKHGVSEKRIKEIKVEQKRRELERLINLANLLPPTQVAADLDEILGRDESRFYSSEEGFSFELEKYKLLLVYLERFPPHFREYVLEDSKKSLAQIKTDKLSQDSNIKHFVKIYGALGRYDEFRKVREKLRGLIRITHEPSGLKRHALQFFHRISIHASLTVADDGTVKINLDSFADAINGVDATRIRECGDCQRVFWAKRKDQSCCSKDCANRFHVRRHREKYASDPIAHKLHRFDREEKSGTKKGR